MSRIPIGTRPILLATCVGVLVIACCLVSSAHRGQGTTVSADTSSVVPTAEFIAAAMKDQASATIEADYSSPLYRYHYVRTAQALSMARKHSEDPGDPENSSASYEFAARETRVIQPDNNGTMVGTSKVAIADPFTQLDGLDPVMFVLPWALGGAQFLYEQISSGQVLPQQEDIDGHQCWRVDLTTDMAGLYTQKSTVWVDPDIGFCPRRIQIIQRDARYEPTVIHFLDYKELSPRMWFPMKQSNELTVKRVKSGATTFERKTFTYSVTKVTAGGKFDKDSLLVKFPSGTKLYVNYATPVTVP